jgi:hypothetical protein
VPCQEQKEDREPRRIYAIASETSWTSVNQLNEHVPFFSEYSSFILGYGSVRAELSLVIQTQLYFESSPSLIVD